MTPEQKKVLEKEYNPKYYDFEVDSETEGGIIVLVKPKSIEQLAFYILIYGNYIITSYLKS